MPTATIYDGLRSPKLLKDRWENEFPLIHIGDRVIGTSNWAVPDKRNPDEGKTGTVVGIEHGFQSIFNRDYLIVTLKESGSERQSWLYTLDLLERNPQNVERIKNGQLIYIDDRVETETHTGNVRAIRDIGGKLQYEVRYEDTGVPNLVDASSVKLIERFPPNDLWKVN